MEKSERIAKLKDFEAMEMGHRLTWEWQDQFPSKNPLYMESNTKDNIYVYRVPGGYIWKVEKYDNDGTFLTMNSIFVPFTEFFAIPDDYFLKGSDEYVYKENNNINQLPEEVNNGESERGTIRNGN